MSTPVRPAAIRTREFRCGCDVAFISILCWVNGGYRLCRSSIRTPSVRGRSAQVRAQTYTGFVRLLDRCIAPPITRVAECVACREQHGCPGERSYERALHIELRSPRRCNVVEKQACNDGADDTQSEVQHDTLAGTLAEPEGDVAGDESEKDEDND